jgi:hypothetical protein
MRGNNSKLITILKKIREEERKRQTDIRKTRDYYAIKIADFITNNLLIRHSA